MSGCDAATAPPAFGSSAVLLPSVVAERVPAQGMVCALAFSPDGRALAMLRLDRADDALAAGHALVAGAVTLRLVKPDWARFAFPGERKQA